jgi:hypothetical protein
MTTKPVWLSLLVAALAVAALSADDKKPDPHKEPIKHAGLDQFKKLAGDWVGKEPLGEAKGKEFHVQYKVTSNGSTVVETIAPGTEHEMITVIHPDGDDLLLTHYCALGNQPQMKASSKGDGKSVAFKFVRATNMKSDKDMHMHEVTYTFVDADTLKAEWTHYNEGKAAGKVTFELKRKK